MLCRKGSNLLLLSHPFLQRVMVLSLKSPSLVATNTIYAIIQIDFFHYRPVVGWLVGTFLINCCYPKSPPIPHPQQIWLCFFTKNVFISTVLDRLVSTLFYAKNTSRNTVEWLLTIEAAFFGGLLACFFKCTLVPLQTTSVRRRHERFQCCKLI